jgi:hypothetical protein
MTRLIEHANRDRELGHLTPETTTQRLCLTSPVLATPAIAAAAGVAVTAGAFAAGYAAEEAGDG